MLALNDFQQLWETPLAFEFDRPQRLITAQHPTTIFFASGASSAPFTHTHAYASSTHDRMKMRLSSATATSLDALSRLESKAHRLWSATGAPRRSAAFAELFLPDQPDLSALFLMRNHPLPLF